MTSRRLLDVFLPLCALTVLATTDAGSVSSAAEKTFRAGAFAADITPESFPTSLNGGMRDNPATRVHDPLHARCLVLEDGTTKLVLVVCDSCAISREIFDAAKERAAKETGIPRLTC